MRANVWQRTRLLSDRNRATIGKRDREDMASDGERTSMGMGEDV
jgi:hypothetical protein